MSDIKTIQWAAVSYEAIEVGNGVQEHTERMATVDGVRLAVGRAETDQWGRSKVSTYRERLGLFVHVANYVFTHYTPSNDDRHMELVDCNSTDGLRGRVCSHCEVAS